MLDLQSPAHVELGHRLIDKRAVQVLFQVVVAHLRSGPFLAECEFRFPALADGPPCMTLRPGAFFDRLMHHERSFANEEGKLSQQVTTNAARPVRDVADPATAQGRRERVRREHPSSTAGMPDPPLTLRAQRAIAHSSGRTVRSASSLLPQALNQCHQRLTYEPRLRKLVILSWSAP
jgi:hypothetical protein